MLFIKKKNEFIKIFKEYKFKKLSELQIEYFCEKIKKWDNQKVSNIILWHKRTTKRNNVKINKISLRKMKNWNIDKNLKKIQHSSKHFFTIEGYKISNASTREVSEWCQPLIKQVNFKGGVIGLVRSEFNGVPHYLVQSKFEPGNIGKNLISPSVQSTYSNLNRKHNGKGNIYLKYFTKKNTLYKKWINEDGGRFMKKQNLHWIVKVDSKIKISQDYRWITLWDIIYLSKKTNYINCHLRTLISHLN
tara:strand:- start:1028 stop:1768 length:741 start_codon:yes stop_codon:yes gene_type:complete